LRGRYLPRADPLAAAIAPRARFGHNAACAETIPRFKEPRMIARLTLAAIAVSLCSVPAFAQEDLAKKNGCTACHAVDKKIVGPSFKEVAAKYRNDKTAEAKLIDKVKKGGVGVWGQVPMPPNTTVKDEDIKTLVKWVLSLK
jgi:cytochrome c